MCFSPQVSFGAAAVLAVFGAVGLRKTGLTRFALVAVVPCIFAVQQMLEGFVWLAIGRGDASSYAYVIPVYAYLFFAGVWWPFYWPLVLRYLEPNHNRKKWLWIPIVAGCTVAVLSLLNFYFNSVTVAVVDHHIAYQQTQNLPFGNVLYYVALVLYLIAISGGLFISTLPYASTMGWLIILAFFAAQIWYYFAFGSVWCFFAALCSALILFALQ